jgi:hypothetical protein
MVGTDDLLDNNKRSADQNYTTLTDLNKHYLHAIPVRDLLDMPLSFEG